VTGAGTTRAIAHRAGYTRPGPVRAGAGTAGTTRACVTRATFHRAGHTGTDPARAGVGTPGPCAIRARTTRAGTS